MPGQMKTLSIIGIVLFGLLLLSSLGFAGDLETELELLESLSGYAGLVDAEAGQRMTEFAEAVWGALGALFVAGLYGLALSIVGCVVASKPKDRA